MYVLLDWCQIISSSSTSSSTQYSSSTIIILLRAKIYYIYNMYVPEAYYPSRIIMHVTSVYNSSFLLLCKLPHPSIYIYIYSSIVPLETDYWNTRQTIQVKNNVPRRRGISRQTVPYGIQAHHLFIYYLYLLTVHFFFGLWNVPKCPANRRAAGEVLSPMRDKRPSGKGMDRGRQWSKFRRQKTSIRYYFKISKDKQNIDIFSLENFRKTNNT